MRLLALSFAAASLHAQADFASEVHPIFAARCAGCHSGPNAQAGLKMDDRASLVKARAKIVPKVRGALGTRMPPTGDPLSEAQIQTLERWVSADLPWADVGAKAASKWQAPLAPRVVALPQNAEINPIDKFVAAYNAKRGLAWRPMIDEATFAKRVYLDLWGVTPSYEQMQPAKDRTALIDKLLADREMFAGHWISFWNDLLRNDNRAYHGEAKPYTPWLKKAIESNAPYDAMVRQLINPAGPDAPEGFLVGVNWRGDVNASQLPHMQAAQNTAQVFLGVNLKCASCHDSFINKYQLRQSYGMAAIFSEQAQLELIRCDARTGKMQGPEFLFPSLGAIKQDGTIAERRAQAAALFTHPQNGRVARTFVNRIWGRLFGRGLVEPVDDMDAEPWNADLLDWLANDFAANNSDINHLLKLILTSKAWQQQAAPIVEEKSYTFRGPQPRRITAEQFVDSLSALTGEWRLLQNDRSARFAREWEFKSTALTRALGRPIRDQVYTTRPPESSTLQALELVNGTTLAQSLRRGAQRLNGTLPAPPEPLFDSKAVRRSAGTRFRIDVAGKKEIWLLIEDAGSYDWDRTIAGWHDLRFDDNVAAQPSQTQPLKSVAFFKQSYNALTTPVGKAVHIAVPDGARTLKGTIVMDDIGRISEVNSAARFFIFPSAPDRNLLTKVSDAPPVASPKPETDAAKLTDRLFWQTLGRAPAPAEKTIAIEQLKANGGLEDLLWSLLLHPEFQYVR
ncbi:MAG: DUF1549 domain-containing protein [Acidobacteria bacterium]|nr:DUF1549 domain-containing protein [Acidobacteriota bacterium]